MRNRLHSICPYFAMFPEIFVQKHLIWSRPGDVVLDPFCGRGTTVLEALLNRREALGGDTNPVAVCVSRAKADPPSLSSVVARLRELEHESHGWHPHDGDLTADEFFQLCFAPGTLTQLLFLRERLQWRRRRTDAFIAALALGCLHGESHRTGWCFSNRMPRTISTKPAYSIRWWRERGSLPPERDVFAILQDVARYRFLSARPSLRGRVTQADARRLSTRFAAFAGRVSLVITSPPYLDTTDYREDQWLRLWFLGGPSRPHKQPGSDDRHRGAASYWAFLTEAWRGIAPLLRDGARLVVRIGGRRVERATVEEDLVRSLKSGLGGPVKVRDRRSSRIVNGQLHAFRPGAAGTQVEHDFVFQVA